MRSSRRTQENAGECRRTTRRMQENKTCKEDEGVKEGVKEV